MSLHHVFGGERLTAFSDAVFAIIVTIMVIPLKLTDKDIEDAGGEEVFNLEEWLEKGTFFFKFLIYMYSYMAVIHFWYSHNRLFRLVELVDDILAWLNLVLLLFVSFLPAAINMVYYFTSQHIVLTICIGNILLGNTALLIMMILAFRQRSLLHPRLLKDIHLFYPKLLLYLPLLINMAVGVIALIFAWGLRNSPQVGFTLFYSMAFLPYIALLITKKLHNKLSKSNTLPSDQHDYKFLFRHIVSKERAIAFSDGVFSIVATLLILDIATEVPESNENVYKFLASQQYELTTYLASFVIVGLLWCVHHSMFQYFKEITPLLTTFNSLSLLLIGLIPFGSGVVSHFAEGLNTDNEVTSIRTFSIVLVVASLGQLVLWSVAHCERNKCLSSDADNIIVELLQLAKLLIFPLMGLLIYFATFSEEITVHHFFTYLIYITPVLFILPRICAKLFSRWTCYTNRPSSTVQETHVESSQLLLNKSAVEGQYALQIQQDKVSVGGEVEEDSAGHLTSRKTEIMQSENV